MFYGPAAVVEALGRVDVHMRQAGFLASRTTVDAVVRQEAARVDLRVTVDAGPRSILREVDRRGRRCEEADRGAGHRLDAGRAGRSAGGW